MTQREAFEAWWGWWGQAPVELQPLQPRTREDTLSAWVWEAWQAAQAAQPAQVPAELSLNIIRKWPDGFQKRLDHVWKDVDGFIPNVKLYDLQRTLAEFGFTMKVYEQAAQPAQVPAWQPIESGFPATGIPVLADIGEKYPIRACWIAKFTQEVGASDFEGDDDYDEATDTTYWPEGWYEWNRFDETHWLVDKPVKNWALLPAAPEVK